MALHAAAAASSAAAVSTSFRHCRHHHYQQLQHFIRRRNFAVYVTGEGWTGALGTGNLTTTTTNTQDNDENGLIPLPLPQQDLEDDLMVTDVATGWGHTALITQSIKSAAGGVDSGSNKLWVTGRPYDFQTLLRLKRLPNFIRQGAAQHSLRYSTDEFGGSSSGNTTSLYTKMMSFLAQEKIEDRYEEDARMYGVLTKLTEMPFPNGDMPMTTGEGGVNQGGTILDASAGLTTIIGQSGTLYTFGLNPRGQCGIGNDVTNNIWTPTPVVGLSTEFPPSGREMLVQQYPIVSVALGLQHGLALDMEGNLFAWGKGTRGQLGQGLRGGEYSELKSCPFAVRVLEFVIPGLDGSRNDKILSKKDAKVRKISAGMNCSAAVTETNHVFVWGKNVAPPDNDDDSGGGWTKRGARVVDSPTPIAISGLPSNLHVVDISCGSHHTAILLEDGSVYGIGIATDNGTPLVNEAVLMIPPGLLDMPLRQFTSHFDRTTIVGKNGKQVLDVQLWSHEELRVDAAVEPLWLESLVRREVDVGKEGTVRMVRKGWLHSVIVTD